MAKRKPIGPRPAFERGQRVTVNGSYTAVVVNLKPSSQSGWWADVRRDDTPGVVYSIPAGWLA